jgi:hypothetical protein
MPQFCGSRKALHECSYDAARVIPYAVAPMLAMKRSAPDTDGGTAGARSGPAPERPAKRQRSAPLMADNLIVFSAAIRTADCMAATMHAAAMAGRRECIASTRAGFAEARSTDGATARINWMAATASRSSGSWCASGAANAATC